MDTVCERLSQEPSRRGARRSPVERVRGPHRSGARGPRCPQGLAGAAGFLFL